MHADHFSWFNAGDLSVNGCHNNNHIAPLNTTLCWSLRDFSNLSIRGRGHCPSSLTAANGCRQSLTSETFHNGGMMVALTWRVTLWLQLTALPTVLRNCDWQTTISKIATGPEPCHYPQLLVLDRSDHSNYPSHWDLSLHVFISP